MGASPLPSVRGLTVVLVAAAVLAAGCGGGGDGGDEPTGVEAKAWATDVCGGLLTWKNTVVRRSNEISTKVAGVNDLTKLRRIYVDYLGLVTGDTDRMLVRVEDAGIPAVDKGRELRADFLGALRPMKTAFVEAKQNAATLPTDDRAAFISGISAQNDTLTSRLNKINSAFDTLENKYDVPELEDAFKEVPACKSFSSS
jgi:hypothetical protein